jgi:hypothetical protein
MRYRNILAVCAIVVLSGAADPSLFDSSGDVGDTPAKGKVEYDAAKGEYRVTGGGANIWATADAFYFVSKKISGDVAITADVHFVGDGAVAHRKAALMIRQSLDPGSAYADVALHGDGLTSLQFRPTAGVATEEVRSDLKGPVRIRIERRGNQFTMLAGAPGGELKASGPATVALQDPVYVGLAMCSHKADALETAVFSNVKVEPLQAPRPRYSSRITVYDVAEKNTKVVHRTDETFEAPNWSPDGKYLLSNSRGRLYRVSADGQGEPVALPLDASLRCNNDHGFSPDGKRIAISASTATSRGSQVYVASVDGAEPKMVVSKVPSYFHGWSPDGKFLAIVGQRNGNFDLFRVPANGGEEERLTSSAGYDDGPDYSPDGKWIYFNSDRSGKWDIWRMEAGGAGPGDALAERVTFGETEDWFPHPSPDGKWLVYLSFPKGTKTHNDKLKVQLRMIPMPKNKLKKKVEPKVLEEFFGGQGTINVNSWSPDSKKFAYVVYEQAVPR